MAKEGHTQIGIVIPDELVTRIKVESVRRNMNHSALVTEVLDEALPRDVRIVGGESRSTRKERSVKS